MSSYSEFLSFVKSDGLAKQNRYMVYLSAPSIQGDFAAYMQQKNIRDLLLLSKSVNVPGVNVATGEVRTTGEVINAPYDRNFGAATFTFYVDSGMYVRKFFDDWINAIQHPKKRTVGWYSDFAVPDISILVIPKSELGVVYRMTLHDCFPKSMGALSLDQGSNDIMTLDVEIDFHYYTTEIIETIRTSSQNVTNNFGVSQSIDKIPGAIGASDRFTYKAPKVPPKIQGTNSAKGAIPTSVDDLNNFVQLDPISTLRNGFPGLLNTFNTDFTSVQSSLSSGQVTFNGITVPLSVDGAINMAKQQSMQTVRSAVTNAIKTNIPNINISGLF